MITEMAELRKLCAQYHPRDIYNMDETGLYWKRVPDRSLAIESVKGIKKAKDRIIIALTTNTDSSEKLEPWVISKFKNPRCLARVNRRLLGIKYRYNKSKWMNSVICEEFLRWFDRLMRGRKVLLLMDNFSAHILAAQLTNSELLNTTIAWLPANTTSHWQLMDQGIIASYKL